jgi:hypothetical protein
MVDPSVNTFLLEIMKEAIIVNNKNSAKYTWKRKQQLDIAAAIKEFFADRGFNLPVRADQLFGRSFGIKMTEQTERVYNIRSKVAKEADLMNDFNHIANYGAYVQKMKKRAMSFEDYTRKKLDDLIKAEFRKLKKEHQDVCDDRAMRFFTDKETGEICFDEYAELARAYYTLRDSSPAVYAIFKHRTNDHYLKQMVAMSCSRHRLDPVWNFQKSKLIRGIWFRFLEKTRLHEQFQPMHLMLTVPHTDGQWKGKKFYAREFIEKFNLMRKYSGWKRCMFGGEYGIEVTRKGSNGLHIHLHSLVFQHKQFRRDLVNRYIRMIWRRLTGAQVTWYETLYVHRKDESGKFIMEASADGIPVIDRSGQYTDDIRDYSMETAGIRGKKMKFYLDESEPWFTALSPEERMKHYLNGVMECIKYHFKIDCFRKGRDEWDVDLMKDVLRYSKGLRMYSKFGAFYREKELNYSRLEKPDLAPAELNTAIDENIAEAEKSANLHPLTDGIEGRVINPYTRKPCERGDYVVVLSLPESVKHYGRQRDYQPIISNLHHEGYFKIRPFIPLRRILSSIMKQTTSRQTDHPFREIMLHDDYVRWRENGWKSPRDKLFI